jgi:chromate transporter
MNGSITLTLGIADWQNLFFHYLSLSLMSIGGAITTAPEMHHYLVEQKHWLSDGQFNASMTMAQAAPGPNVLFVALLGWNVGMNAGGGLVTAMLGVALTMSGILMPSTTLTYLAARWAHRNKNLRSVIAFKQGLAPIVIALIVATAWTLARANNPSEDWRLWGVTICTALLLWRCRPHVLWLLGAGAVLGWFGIV